MKDTIIAPEVARQLSEESGKPLDQIHAAIDAAKKELKQRPTKEQVVQWFESDMHAACYALTAICSMPVLMRQLAEKFYDETTRQMEEKETKNGASN